MSSKASIVIFTSNGVPALRAALHGIRETVNEPHELQVFASDCSEELGMFLMRQHLRGRVQGLHLETGAGLGPHCGLDRAYHLTTGEYIVRLDDTVRPQPGWLTKAIAAMEADPSIGCLALLPPPGYHRGRGRPPTVHIEPVMAEYLEMGCYVTRRELVAHHEAELMSESHEARCVFQRYLAASGRRLAYLPGLVKRVELAQVPQVAEEWHEGELPLHGGASGTMQRLHQTYQLGDDILLTCLACGASELEVLEVRILFCDAHWAAIGHMYELRCPECKELYYREDAQFRCGG